MPEIESLQGERNVFYAGLCKKADKWPTRHWPGLFYRQLQRPPCTVHPPTSLCATLSVSTEPILKTDCGNWYHAAKVRQHPNSVVGGWRDKGLTPATMVDNLADKGQCASIKLGSLSIICVQLGLWKLSVILSGAPWVSAVEGCLLSRFNCKVMDNAEEELHYINTDIRADR